MFINSPNDGVALVSAFCTGIGALIFGVAGYYGIKSAIIKILRPTNEQAVRNR